MTVLQDIIEQKKVKVLQTDGRKCAFAFFYHKDAKDISYIVIDILQNIKVIVKKYDDGETIIG